MNVEQIAKFCHNILANYGESIGEAFQTWSNLHHEKRKSMRNGVEAHLENPNMSPQEAHDHWRNIKRNAGWIYGEEKDETKKEHPNLAAYEQLPENQKAKAVILKSIVNNIADLIP